MSYWPRDYRKQLLQHKLKDVLSSPYTDQADAAAARNAIEQKLDEQDRDIRLHQQKAVNRYKKML